MGNIQLEKYNDKINIYKIIYFSKNQKRIH